MDGIPGRLLRAKERGGDRRVADGSPSARADWSKRASVIIHRVTAWPGLFVARSLAAPEAERTAISPGAISASSRGVSPRRLPRIRVVLQLILQRGTCPALGPRDLGM